MDGKVICFDLWKTLVDSPSEFDYVDLLLEAGVNKKEIYPFVRSQLMIRDFSGYHEIVAKLMNRFKLTDRRLKDELIRRWIGGNQNVQWLTNAQRAIALARQNGATVVLVSNLTGPGWRDVERMLGISQHFDYRFLSFAERAAKPDGQVWKRVEEKYQKASEFWMIGDSAEDDMVVPAQKGWRVVHANDQMRARFFGLQTLRTGEGESP